MATPLPARPSLDWLRKRASLTLRQLRRTRPTTRLAQAQLAVAREHGFPSWRALKAHIDARRHSPAEPASPLDEDLVARFLRQVATGTLPAVREALATHPALANAVGPHPFWGGRPQPLHVAIESRRRAMFDLLLRSGADPNGSNEGYMHWSPLMLASDWRRRGMYQALLRRGAKVGLVEALMKGDDRTVLRMLRPGRPALPAVVPNGGSLLMFARTPRAIDHLLELGVPTDRRDHWGATPVEALSRLGRAGRPLVRHLQKRGVKAGPAAFARMGDRVALATLATQAPDLLREPAVLVGAVEFKHHSLVRWLLDQGADPNARANAESAHTALHSAAWNGDLPMARLLLARGANPALRDRQYDATPLGWAETSIEVTANTACRKLAGYLRSLVGGPARNTRRAAPRSGSKGRGR